MNLAGEPKYSEETCPGATLSTTKSHMMTRSQTPDRSGGKPANNRLSYGATSPLGSLLPLLEHRAEFPQFLNQGQSVGLLGRVICSSQGLYLYTNTEKHTHTYTNTKHPCPEWDCAYKIMEFFHSGHFEE
jgi:hypothetical protein